MRSYLANICPSLGLKRCHSGPPAALLTVPWSYTWAGAARETQRPRRTAPSVSWLTATAGPSSGRRAERRCSGLSQRPSSGRPRPPARRRPGRSGWSGCRRAGRPCGNSPTSRCCTESGGCLCRRIRPMATSTYPGEVHGDHFCLRQRKARLFVPDCQAASAIDRAEKDLQFRKLQLKRRSIKSIQIPHPSEHFLHFTVDFQVCGQLHRTHESTHGITGGQGAAFLWEILATRCNS